MHIFISHSSKDADEAVKLCEFLENNGIKCFIAPRDIRAGKQYAEELVRGIDESEAMVLLMSKEANQSPHVLREVERQSASPFQFWYISLKKWNYLNPWNIS